MSESKAKSNHMGTKFLSLVIGLVLAVIYTLRTVFEPSFVLTEQVAELLYAWVIFVIVIPLIVMLAEIIWRYFHVYSEKLPVGT